MKRRTFIKGIAQAGIVAAASPSLRGFFAKSSQESHPLAFNELRIPPVISGGDMKVALTTYEIYSGIPSNVFSINNTFVGPTIKLKKGDTFTAKVINNLTEPTVIHWHGIHAPALMDGHPKNSISPGGSYDISYPIIQRAGTFFYHSHADMNTAQQSYLGMTGCFIIEDDEEKVLGLPSGDFDIPLMIQDKRFDTSKQLVYDPKDQDMFGGWLGDTILINGTPNASLSVAPTLYRFRLINASNARMYKIGLSDNSTFTIIGNDGGLLDKPVDVTSAMLGPAERFDILIDFTSYAQGKTVNLQSFAFLFSGSPGTGTLQQGVNFDLMQFQVAKTGLSGGVIPKVLPAITAYNIADIKNSRLFQLTGHQYINSQSFDMNRIDQHVPFGDLEKWTFTNQSEEIHPMHIHSTQFQVLNRGNGNPPLPGETGWKDVVRVNPGETVNVLVQFSEYKGLYLVHCHNLEHEDMGMMSNFQVEDPSGVKEEDAVSNTIEITPNPASDQTVLKFSPLLTQEELIITDMKGEIVFRKMLMVGSKNFRLETKHLPIGNYHLVLGNNVSSLVVMR